MVNTHTRETIDIESSGSSVKINLFGRTMCEVAIRGDSVADYRVDGREDKDAQWLEGVLGDPEYSGEPRYDDILETGWNQLRIYCVNGTGITDEEAEIVLCAAD